MVNVNAGAMSNLGPGNAAAAATNMDANGAYTQLRSLSEDRELNGIVSRGLEGGSLDMQQAGAQGGAHAYNGDGGGNKQGGWGRA